MNLDNIKQKITELEKQKAQLEAEAPIIIRERMLGLEQTLRAEITTRLESFDQRIGDLEALLNDNDDH